MADLLKDILTFDAEEEEWITTKTGSHILLGEGGKVKSGAEGEMKGEKLTKAKSKPSTPSKSKTSVTKPSAAVEKPNLS